VRRQLLGVLFGVEAVRLARRVRPAVVHANDWNTMWAAVAIKLLLGSRVVYDSHELWPDRNGRWESRAWLLACEAVFVRVADRIVVTSPGHGAAIASRHHRRAIQLVRNIPDRIPQPPVAPTDPPVLAYVGGLMPGRGLELAMAALPDLPEVRLLAIGPAAPGFRTHLAARAEALGVWDRVTLRDAVSPSEVQAALGGAACGLCLIEPICLSYTLSLPNKLFEYLWAGLPVLASDLPVIGSLVRHEGLGEVVPAGDPAAIVSGVRRLLDPRRHSEVAERVTLFAQANPPRHEKATLTELYGELVRPGHRRRFSGMGRARIR
jgi:glycosyltransferase involved in cell wall biosynthesis